MALHHIDCPWRPADIEQREGRVIRQGNQNPSVEIICYATEGSFDLHVVFVVLPRVLSRVERVHRATRG